MPRLSFTRRAPCSDLGLLAALLSVVSWGAVAQAGPTLGFVENWTGTTVSTWGGGSAASNPGTGGFSGSSDGFLLVSNAATANLGVRSKGAEYAGDWNAAGITQVRVWLNDVGTSEPLEIHFGFGRDILDTSPNDWQYNVGLIPPLHAWGQYIVDLTAANFTQIHGTGTLADALSNVKTIHLRHDVAPFIGNPDPIQGDFGVDHLLLTNGLVSVEPGPRAGVTRPVQLAAPIPNPSRGSVVMSLDAFDPAPVHLQIVDASGRVVRHVEMTAGAAGRAVWTWDGANDVGAKVAPGYYRARAWNAAGGTSRPLIRIE